MESFTRIVKLILTSPVLDKSDRQVVKGVVYSFQLDISSMEDMHMKWTRQIEIECDALYLLGTYRKLKDEAQIDFDEAEGSAILDDIPPISDTGSKTTVHQAKAYLAVHPELAVGRRRLLEIKDLFENIESLVRIVFARNKKLENLNVDFRRELKSDERAS